MMAKKVGWVATLACVAALPMGGWGVGEEIPAGGGGPFSPTGLVSDWSQIYSALTVPGESEPWKPRVNADRTRGAASGVYPAVAPATVVVRTKNGHGTGFIVDREGWILTNHHVIEDADVDPASGVRRTIIFLGTLGQDGFMQVMEPGIPGTVYKTDQAKDLALVKLERLPDGMRVLPIIIFADKAPAPGADCVVLGHPAAGMLWTVRSGEVSGVGSWPGEMIDVVMQRLAVSSQEREELEEVCRKAPQRKVLMSSCGLNPGDSGGPLVDSSGRLIGVSFAIPGPNGRGVNLDKFSYHLHLDEVKAFLSERPDKPEVFSTEPAPMGTFAATLDLDENGTADTLAVAVARSGPPTGFLFDLDEDSARNAKDSKGRGGEQKWDAEVICQVVKPHWATYDTDNDGKADIMLRDENGDGTADVALQRTVGGWDGGAPAQGELIDGARLTDAPMGRQLAKLLGLLQQKQRGKATAGSALPDGGMSGDQAAPRPKGGGGALAVDVPGVLREYYRLGCEGDGSGQLVFYADEVDYFDQGRMKKADIARDLGKFVTDWPQRKMAIVGEPQVRGLGAKTWDATAMVAVELANPSLGKRHSAVNEVSFRVREGEGNVVAITRMRSRKVR